MKLGEDVLLEIVDIVRRGLTEGVDVSDLLRNIELYVSREGGLGYEVDKIRLAKEKV